MKYILKQKNQIQNEALARQIAKEQDLDISIARIIVNREITSTKEAREFLLPDISQIHDPFLFEQMKDCVSIIKNVIANKGKICVYGDYDADGTCACAIAYLTLKQMGADVSCILPDRLEHGYGLCLDTVKNLTHFALLITVDCGITNVEEIEYLKSKGVKTIITDHHECPHILPKADCILNAKRKGESYPFADLCGAGVAFKLSQALINEQALEYIDIAAIATVSDIVPILNENRAITKMGIEKLNTKPNLGIASLITKSALKMPIDSYSISFSLAPRINSAGRIASAKTALNLLINKGDVHTLSDELCELNAERQRRQEKILEEALKKYSDKTAKVIVLYQENWDIGIVGLAASKLVDTYNKPTILLGKSGEFYTGSARSIPGINIYKALSTQSNLFEKFGGHYGAAGLTLKEENIAILTAKLKEYLEDYNDEVFSPTKNYDLDLALEDISKKFIEDTERLKPFGYKNEQPEILIRNAGLNNIIGICEDKHSKFTLKSNSTALSAVAFGQEHTILPNRADVIGTVSINSYDNRPQMTVRCISYEEISLLDAEMAYILQTNNITEKIKKHYLCKREELSQIFAFLKDTATLTFYSRKQLCDYIEEKCRDIKKVAFAIIVFKEIGLLEIKKGDKIIILIKEGKFELANSKTYAKYM